MKSDDNIERSGEDIASFEVVRPVVIKVHMRYTTFFLHHMTNQTSSSSLWHIGHMVNFDPFYGLADVTTK